MGDTSSGLSRSVEDYLKAIYGISQRGDPASTSAIAEALEVQPASVTGMIKRLAEADLLEHVPYRGVRLTREGSREALRVLRRHRIIETYLCRRLGYTWDDVHGEAERLEHAVSEQLIERMAAALEFPSHDPHGAPIPTSAGQIEDTDFTTLLDVLPGHTVRVRAVRDEDGERLRVMEAHGLTPGTLLRVVERREVGAEAETQEGPQPGGAVAVRVAGAGEVLRMIPVDLAGGVFVVPDDD
ncbi:MAG: metal-dependent transcriptional regulator [Gemmatimonadota bacterium]